jgi:hypothetical protein
MKKIFICIGVTLLFFSCGSEGSENDSGTTSSDSTNVEVAETDPCEDISNVEDVSDSLKSVLDEILEKQCDYNQAKFDVAMENWEGLQFTLSGLKVDNIYTEGMDELETNRMVLQYGEKWECAFLPVTINFFVDMKSKEELTNYEIGDEVTLNATFSSPINNKASKMGYNMHLNCESVSK